MNFEMYRQQAEQLLLSKAKNNLAREAMISIKELDLSIKVTNDLTNLFQDWLNKLEMVEKTTFLGKGLIQCVVKNEFIGEF